MSAPDAQLRANVRLLGDVLGEVLVEQEGEELLALEERIRGLARGARETGDRAELEETIRALDLDRQAVVLLGDGSTSTRGGSPGSRSHTQSRSCARRGSATRSCAERLLGSRCGPS